MTKARLKISEEDFRALKWEHEVLEQRFEKVRLCFGGLESIVVNDVYMDEKLVTCFMVHLFTFLASVTIHSQTCSKDHIQP